MFKLTSENPHARVNMIESGLMIAEETLADRLASTCLRGPKTIEAGGNIILMLWAGDHHSLAGGSSRATLARARQGLVRAGILVWRKGAFGHKKVLDLSPETYEEFKALKARYYTLNEAVEDFHAKEDWAREERALAPTVVLSTSSTPVQWQNTPNPVQLLLGLLFVWSVVLGIQDGSGLLATAAMCPVLLGRQNRAEVLEALPENPVSRVQTAALVANGTIRRTTHTVVAWLDRDIKGVASDKPLSELQALPSRKMMVQSIKDHNPVWDELALLVSDSRWTQAHDLCVQSVPGLGAAKAAFTLQILGGPLGCLDSRNARDFGIKVSSSPRVYRKQIQTMADNRRMTLSEWSDWIWGFWCVGVANEGYTTVHVCQDHVTWVKKNDTLRSYLLD